MNLRRSKQMKSCIILSILIIGCGQANSGGGEGDPLPVTQEGTVIEGSKSDDVEPCQAPEPAGDRLFRGMTKGQALEILGSPLKTEWNWYGLGWHYDRDDRSICAKSTIALDDCLIAFDENGLWFVKNINAELIDLENF
jgi:hypothetical protein